MANPNPPQSAQRLTFETDGDVVRLVSRRAVDMKTLPSHPLEGYQGKAGFWFEVRDATGKTLYRRIIPNPTPVYREIHSPSGPSTHVPARDRKGAFELVVPPSPPGSVLVLFRSDQPAVSPIGGIAQEKARANTPRVGTGQAREFYRLPLDGGVA